ncbi:MAG: hypothetical protein K6B14_03285 [Lachnospiraceae bacterium]|nr:hypothetical protein [Lachnospiraceae bacterium]
MDEQNEKKKKIIPGYKLNKYNKIKPTNALRESFKDITNYDGFTGGHFRGALIEYVCRSLSAERSRYV